MLKSPVTYVLVAFATMLLLTSVSFAAEVEPSSVYCRVEPSKFKSGGLLGFLRAAVSCKVKLDTEYQLDLSPGKDSINLTIEPSFFWRNEDE